jgi:hypothetical protein
MEEYVTVITFTLPQDAYIIKGRLEADDIECFLKDELTVQVDNFYTNALGGVKLQVKQSDKERTIELLREAGYLLEKDFQPAPFWKLMDRYSSGIPILRRLPLELRAVLVLAGIVLIALALIWLVYN